jgi:hypothetical protein
MHDEHRDGTSPVFHLRSPLLREAVEKKKHAGSSPVSRAFHSAGMA